MDRPAIADRDPRLLGFTELSAGYAPGLRQRGRYLRLSAKPATELPAGSELQNAPEKPVVSGDISNPADSKPAKVPAGFSGGSRSLAARWEEKILARLDAGLDLSGLGRGGSVFGQFLAQPISKVTNLIMAVPSSS